MPVTMTEPPAPPNLLIVRCSCKTRFKSMTCSYRKYGLKCTDSCKECRGVSWVNCEEIDLDRHV